jgi:hypothetical protein
MKRTGRCGKRRGVSERVWTMAHCPAGQACRQAVSRVVRRSSRPWHDENRFLRAPVRPPRDRRDGTARVPSHYRVASWDRISLGVHMYRLIALAILFLGSADIAAAGGGCPSGYTPQDGVCKPYQGPHTGYGYGYRRGYYQPYYYGPRRGRGKPCPEGFTVQDGACRPYRGPTIWYR